MGHINQMARWVPLIATVQWIVSLVTLKSIRVPISVWEECGCIKCV